MIGHETDVDLAYEQGRKDEREEWIQCREEQEEYERQFKYFWDKLYTDAIDTFGEQAQITKCIEECSELIQALCKLDHDNIIEEIVDVEICLSQMKYMFFTCVKDVELFAEIMEYKRNRLQERIDNENL